MPLFAYQGRDREGKKVSGRIEASDTSSVASQLQGEGITPLSISVAKDVSVANSLDLQQVQAYLDQVFKPRVELDELIMMSRQLHSLMRAGVVINKGFRGLAESTKNRRLKEVFIDIERSLNQGMNLTASMRKHPDVFSDLFISIVHVGENTGRLDTVFKQMVGYMEREKETRRSISSAMRYPMFVIGALGLAMVVLNLFVIPIFAKIFEQNNAELPWTTVILITSSNLFVNYWPLLLIAVGVLFFGVRAWLNTVDGRLLWDRYKLRLPVVGGILEKAMISRFSRSFALMLRSGVSMLQALEMCSKAVGNSYLAEKILQMKNEVERGESLLRITTNSGMFSPLVLQMIAVGEETGQVDDLLDEVATFYDEEVDYSLSTLSSVIEPILILGITGIVGLLAMGIFVPMWDMMKVVK